MSVSRRGDKVAPAAAATRSAHRDWRSGPWLPALAAIACYLPALFNGFTYDDVPIVQKNPRVTRLSAIPELWLTDYWKPGHDKVRVVDARRDRLYRPLTLTTYCLDAAWQGVRPLGYHLVNVLLHALLTALVWRFAERLTGDRLVASVAALLFAVHPIHVEAVANVVGRAELLSALGTLLGLLTLMPRGASPSLARTGVAAVLFFLALTAKESAVCYWPVAVLALVAGREAPPWRQWRWWLWRGGLLAIPTLVYLPLRYVALDGHLTRVSAPAHHMNPLSMAGPLDHIVGVFTIVGHYARLFVLPQTLSADYGLAVIDPGAGANALTLVGVLAAVAALVALVGFTRRTGQWRRAALLTAITLASYALISNAVLIIGVSMAERLMYWPSVPILVLAAVGVRAAWDRLRRLPKVEPRTLRLISVLALALPLALGVRSLVRSTDWRSNLTLFSVDVESYPASVQINLALASAISRLPKISGEQMEQAEQCIARALAILPANNDVLQTGAVLAKLKGDTARAEEYLELATAAGPLDELSQEIHAQVSGRFAKLEQEIAALRNETDAEPNNAPAFATLGDKLLEVGRFIDALAAARRAAELAPDDLEVRWLLARALIGNDKGEEALPALRGVLELDPNHWRAHTQLAVFRHRRAPAEALQHARRAVELAPNAVESNQNLAEVLVATGQRDEALTIFRRIERGLAKDDPLRAVIRKRIEELEE